jgi:membrane protein required for colicin V production
MNWVDLIIALLLVVSLIIGARRGLFSGVNGLLGLAFGIIVSITYADKITGKVLSHMRISPVMITFVSLIIFFVLTYLIFKILGYLFYKFAELKPMGRIGRVTGAILGVFEGGIVIGFLLILVMLLPLPEGVFSELDNSFFAPGLRGTIPFIYEETAFVHPQSPSFVEKMKQALMQGTDFSENQRNLKLSPETQAERIIQKMEYYFPSS